MSQAATLFLTSFTTLLAIINPFESLPVFLKLLEGKDRQTHRQVAWRACSYATLLLFSFWSLARHCWLSLRCRSAWCGL